MKHAPVGTISSLALAAALLFAGCDIPTQPPDFSFSTDVRAPLLVDKTFVLMGPAADGHEVLIDTTSETFESIFSVSEADNSVAIVQKIEGFDLGAISGFAPAVHVPPVAATLTFTDLVDTAPLGSGGGLSAIPFSPNGETFSHGYSIDVDVDGLAFDDPADYAALKSGRLYIDNLKNEFDVDLDVFRVSIPSLRRAPYTEADSLVVRFEGDVDDPDSFTFRQLSRRSGPRYVAVDVSSYRLYPTDGHIVYNVAGQVESTSETRTIELDDALRFDLGLDETTVAEVSAVIEPFSIAVTPDVDDDEILDLLDDREAKTAELSGLDVFDELSIQGFELTGTELRFDVTTDVTADVVLYAVIAAVNGDGETVYLEGKGPTSVSTSDSLTSGFREGASFLPSTSLIRLELPEAPSASGPSVRTIVLDDANSNVDAFLSAAPTSLRYVAKLLVQPDGGRALLREPFNLDVALGATIPLAVSGGFTLEKTIEADLDGIRSVTGDKDVGVEEAGLVLRYGNGLPLGVDARIDVLDGAGEVLLSLPQSGESLEVVPASTDADGLAMEPGSGTVTIGLSRSELETMSGGRSIRLGLAFATASGGKARLRASDAFTVRLAADLKLKIASN